MPLAAQLRAAADKVNPDFLFAGEGPQDWLMQYYPSPISASTAGSTPVCRYIDPQAPLMVAVTGFDDREMLNLILLDRYIISYEPYNFKGHLTDFPLTLAYGKKIDALRRKYKAWLWDAEFRDTLGATITADGAPRYSVFVGHPAAAPWWLSTTILTSPSPPAWNCPIRASSWWPRRKNRTRGRPPASSTFPPAPPPSSWSNDGQPQPKRIEPGKAGFHG